MLVRNVGMRGGDACQQRRRRDGSRGCRRRRAGPGEDAAATAQLLFQLSESYWSVGALFFGLWLIPMGWGRGDVRPLPAGAGWILVAGGVASVVSAFVDNAVATPASLVGALTIPATIGEF